MQFLNRFKSELTAIEEGEEPLVEILKEDFQASVAEVALEEKRRHARLEIANRHFLGAFRELLPAYSDKLAFPGGIVIPEQHPLYTARQAQASILWSVDGVFDDPYYVIGRQYVNQALSSVLLLPATGVSVWHSPVRVAVDTASLLATNNAATALVAKEFSDSDAEIERLITPSGDLILRDDAAGNMALLPYNFSRKRHPGVVGVRMLEPHALDTGILVHRVSDEAMEQLGVETHLAQLAVRFGTQQLYGELLVRWQAERDSQQPLS